VNKTRFAVLGLLSIRPMSGYDLKQVIEASTRNFWNESYGQIYPVLRELTADGLTTREEDRREGGRERHIYTLTRLGQEELQKWLVEPVERQQVRNELLLKLFFGAQVPVEVTIGHVERFRGRQQRALRRYEEAEATMNARESPSDPNRQHWLITLSYGRHQAQAAIEWSEETLSTLRRSAPER
jgi:PadR family transcriptional regulator, regulatory protein AphA